MKMKGKAMILTAALAVGCLLPTAAMAESSDVGLKVNDSWVTCDETTGVPYINDSGRTMVPLRVVNDYFDYTTDWSSDGAVDVNVQAGRSDYTANGEAGQFETAPVIRDGRTYLPARDFGELYGSVYWDGVDRIVWLSDSAEPAYQIIRDQIIRATKDAIEPVPLSDGWTVHGGGDGHFIFKVEKEGGENYLYISQGHSHMGGYQDPVFRDDGDKLTYIATFNHTSSIAVDGDTVYYTMGTEAATWTDYIVPECLYAATVGDGDSEITYTLDFAVNECDLAIEDGNLIATAPDGTRHVVDLATLVPDESGK